MTKEMLTAGLLGLFGASGPVARLLSLAFHLDDGTVHAILDICTGLTPLVAGAIFVYLQRPTGIVSSVASLSPQAQHEALNSVSDSAKVQIAEAVPGVATVVIKDTANGSLGALAQSDAHPNVVTETQNEADAKKGTKT